MFIPTIDRALTTSRPMLEATSPPLAKARGMKRIAEPMKDFNMVSTILKVLVSPFDEGAFLFAPPPAPPGGFWDS